MLTGGTIKNILLWPPFVFQTAPLLLGKIAHSFMYSADLSFQASWRTCPSVDWGCLSVSSCSARLTPWWWDQGSVGGLNHLLEDTLFSFLLKKALYDSGRNTLCIFMLQNTTDQAPPWQYCVQMDVSIEKFCTAPYFPGTLLPCAQLLFHLKSFIFPSIYSSVLVWYPPFPAHHWPAGRPGSHPGIWTWCPPLLASHPCLSAGSDLQSSAL